MQSRAIKGLTVLMILMLYHISLGAVFQQQEFEVYIVPTCRISQGASNIHNIYKSGNRLVTGDGKRIDAVSPHEGLNLFMNWLGSIPVQNLVLVAHNGKKFDKVILENNLYLRGIETPGRLRYADSMDIMRKIQAIVQRQYRDGREILPNIKFDTSLQYLCGFNQPPIHGALNDARNLKTLCAAAANFLRFPSYAHYLNQNNNEIFQ